MLSATAISRDSDLIARIGGDEFVVAAWLENGYNDLMQVAERLIDQLESPKRIKDLQLPMTTSVVCSLWAEGKTVLDLVREADQAMYLAKSSGTNRIAISGELVTSR